MIAQDVLLRAINEEVKNAIQTEDGYSLAVCTMAYYVINESEVTDVFSTLQSSLNEVQKQYPILEEDVKLDIIKKLMSVYQLSISNKRVTLRERLKNRKYTNPNKRTTTISAEEIFRSLTENNELLIKQIERKK